MTEEHVRRIARDEIERWEGELGELLEQQTARIRQETRRLFDLPEEPTVPVDQASELAQRAATDALVAALPKVVAALDRHYHDNLHTAIAAALKDLDGSDDYEAIGA